ncbi:hypothetical protein ACFRFL_34390 [Streptomyces sp. NPDC056708]|uniref:hypothetical protein n=1 Tax=unclassified Streptomyces TaxID=2593676 RepID=UPI0036A9C4A0
MRHPRQRAGHVTVFPGIRAWPTVDGVVGEWNEAKVADEVRSGSSSETPLPSGTSSNPLSAPRIPSGTAWCSVAYDRSFSSCRTLGTSQPAS